MDNVLQIAITIFCSVLASSGLWSYLMRRADRKDAKTEMLIGLGHDRIMFLSKTYIERGYVSVDEYNDLVNYLYKPYKKLGGNGTAEKIMQEVEKLPIK